MIVAQKALNLEEFSMDRAILRIFTGISNAFVAFTISVAAGVLLLLLSIYLNKLTSTRREISSLTATYFSRQSLGFKR